jgi:large subunit ribosomal protein L4
MKFPVYNLEGKKVKDIELSEKVFGLKENDALLHQVYVSQYANRRHVLAHTKDRAERAGSGKKPWRQKGTGRARAGSVRSPIWRKGGVIFGPTKDRNFKRVIPQKMNRKALAIALSGKARDKEVVVVDSLKLRELKTKSMRQAVDNLKLKGSILVGLSKSEALTSRASRNIPEVDSAVVENLNVFDILNHKYLVVSEEGIKSLEKRYEYTR